MRDAEVHVDTGRAGGVSPLLAPGANGHVLQQGADDPRPPAAAPLLLFEHVSKWYGTVLALNQVTLELTGGITGLVGANGAGKSTLLRLATGMLKPTLGRVSVRGLDARDWRARRLVGYCPDTDAFYEDMSGREFVRLMARLCGYDRKETDWRTETVLRRVGMSDRSDRRLRGY